MRVHDACALGVRQPCTCAMSNSRCHDVATGASARGRQTTLVSVPACSLWPPVS